MARKALGPPRKCLRRHEGLRERAFGRFEGLTWAEIEAHHPQDALAWRKRVPDFAPPGGESLLQLRERVVTAVDEIAARHPGEQLIAGGARWRAGHPLPRGHGLELQAPRSWDLSNTAVNRLLWSPEGLSLVGWAETGHLQDAALDESTT